MDKKCHFSYETPEKGHHIQKLGELLLPDIRMEKSEREHELNK